VRPLSIELVPPEEVGIGSINAANPGNDLVV
jgi:hypothetical protein